LCRIRDDDPEIETRKLYQDDTVFVILNAYPFNPGHLMVCPSRHVERLRDMTSEETSALFEMVKKSQAMLEHEFSSTNFNVGINEGPFSGASIDHLHVHVVPRWPRELGFIDTVGKVRAIVFTMDEVYEKLKGKLELIE
jgi:ATP adenylyltransferase